MEVALKNHLTDIEVKEYEEINDELVNGEIRIQVKDSNVIDTNPNITSEKEEFDEEIQIKEENETVYDTVSIKQEFDELSCASSVAEDGIVIKSEPPTSDIESDINDLVEKKDENLEQNASYLNTNIESNPPLIKDERVEIEKESVNIKMNSNHKEINISEENTCPNSLNKTNTQSEISEFCNEQNEDEAASLVNSESLPNIENNDTNASLPVKFQVNRSAIEMVSKENQASELQSLEGLSVYDQTTLETGIMLQVDKALELEAPIQSQSAALLEPDENETEMERQIRLGEMTPFGTSLDKNSTVPTVKPIDGLSEIEKYLTKQLELHSQKKRKIGIKKPSTSLKSGKMVKPKDKENAHDLSKKRILNRDGKRKKKESLGTETEESVSWTNRPGAVAGEKAYIYPDDASGSEYVPSDSDFVLSSEDEKKDSKVIEKKYESPANKRKRKLGKTKPYKIPEDWASDDSDWEYSDEEGNFKKNKRSKKELDDGDVDAFNRRIRMWKEERRQARVDNDTQQFHRLDYDLKIPQNIWDKLYNYQRVGVQWLWELDQQKCGGILGDEMGLGKTIQVIAFLAGLHASDLKDKDTKYEGLGPTLIVCPTTVMHQWVREFHEWYPPLRVAILHESGTFCGKQRRQLIGNMMQAKGVLITSYTGATQHKDDIITRRWHYVILDEGHKIRNPDAQITLVVKQLQTTHRIILSGSPMQNNLKELWSLFDFIFPGKLGTLPVFLEQFAVPITQGGYANASQIQVMTAFKCATVLKDTMAPYLLRRMKADVKSHVKLPEKNEQVLFCRLTDEQRHYYKGYVESGEVSRILEGHLKIFMGLINLRKICNHPDLYVGGPKLLPGEKEEDLPEEERYGHWSKSGKMIVVETLLKLWHKQGHRVLVFTQSRQMLSIMESFVRHANYKYLKLDGTTSIAARQPLINKFNQDTSYFLMLLTTRVGGLGVNLTGANRVLIYDPDWNPATDTQARERAWRIGQQQSVTIYRLITAGTIEEKMYHRQIFKQFLCNKVLKDPRQRRFFKSNDLYELFTLKETDKEGSTETGAIFAGTGSEVKLDPSKTYKHRRIDPKLSAKPPLETFSRKKAEKKKKSEEMSMKEKPGKKSGDSGGEVSFSSKKIEHMKKLAQMLSQKIVQNTSPDKTNSTVEIKTSGRNYEETNDENIDNKIDLSIPSTSSNNSPPLITSKTQQTRREQQTESNDGNAVTKYNTTLPTTSNGSKSVSQSPYEKTHKHKDKKKKKKKRKDAEFEGERIPHLVRAGTSASKPEEENAEDGEKYATQDEYVLQKLFARSGLQTALKHDTIMEGGPADYVLVESEADKVAQQAVTRLKESRHECWQASSGIPNFTGLNGARNFQPLQFGNKKSSLANKSSCDLLELIRKRNGMREVKDPEISLVQDIREFVSAQGGTVHTTQLIDRFEGRLPEGSTPLFKSLISKICTFYRAPDKLGYWTLKEEFNW